MTKDEFGLRLSKDCAAKPGVHVLAAVSGGADSMALLCFFLAVRTSYPLTLSVAHVEHGIRGAESEADLAFVRDVCKANGVAFYAAHVDAPGYARMHGCGLEDAARTLRYAFLNQTADDIGADLIALAHHAQDQAETVLLHAVRGSDIRGLCAMRFRSGRLIRPLLGATAQELRAYLTSIGQNWREDATNADMRYARNCVRHGVMPQLMQINPGAVSSLCRLAEAAQRDEDYFTAQIDVLGLRPQFLIDGVSIEKSRIRDLHPALLGRVLVRMIAQAGIAPQCAQTIEVMMDALKEEKQTVNLTGGAHAHIGQRLICLTRAQEPIEDTPLRIPGETDTPFGRFCVRVAAPGETGDGIHTQAVPLQALCGAVVSARREGDQMIPFGRHTPVRIKKLMIDAGIERAVRRSIPLIRNAEGVLWAVTLRAAQMCCVGHNDTPMIVEYFGESTIRSDNRRKRS